MDNNTIKLFLSNNADDVNKWFETAVALKQDKGKISG